MQSASKIMKRCYSQSKGNMSLFLLVDNSKKSSYAFLEETTLSALEHFGMPYRVFIDKDRGVEHKFESVPAFDDSATISFPLKEKI